ncbi:ABC transporter ATP-binding protein [Microlunatus speluncae]|uniref:ABC transporter ATP-binding protein n=1 Tax=Microlunatus speluncae TaxID=2594267 RepID=UPI00126631AA|nr:ABC transporter ATP-binding protein [Microlunatus speluncae]
MNDDTVIMVRELRRSYRGGGAAFEAVGGIDLEVRRGELYALLGTNGAGKTSALEVIEGLAPATGGTVRVLGLDPYTEAPRLRPRLGIMLQEAGFSDDLTVEETARMWAGTLTTPRPVAEVLAEVDLQDRRPVRVGSLSGGERRRLDLALALLGGPEVLFLDEPTTGLDPESRHAAWRLIRRLLDAGTTIMLTTHYLEEAERLADRIAIMQGGRIATAGTLAEIVADQPARIEFDRPAGDLPRLPGVSLSDSGARVLIETGRLQVTLTALLHWAGDRELTGLSAQSASLEQTFLAVAGGGAGRAAAPVPTAGRSTAEPRRVDTQEVSR